MTKSATEIEIKNNICKSCRLKYVPLLVDENVICKFTPRVTTMSGEVGKYEKYFEGTLLMSSETFMLPPALMHFNITTDANF